MAVFVGVLVKRGKKSKRSMGDRIVSLYGMVFRYRKKVILNEGFVTSAGLDNPKIRDAAINSILHNYGISISMYGKAETISKPVQPPPPDTDIKGESE